MMNDNIYLGSNFDDFLEGEELLEESTTVAIKRVLEWKALEAMKVQKISRTIALSNNIPSVKISDTESAQAFLDDDGGY